MDTSAPGASVTYSSGASGPPDLRFLHYNDVYHISPGSADPVGGAARLVNITNHYRDAPEFASQPPLVTFFSGDAFNPSLESSVTKGRHMVPVLNKIGTDVACLGNHDLDFGVEQFMYLAQQCQFPWLCANVVDPAHGGPIGKLQGSTIIERGGVKIGVVGLVEREWLDTINSLPPNLQYTSAAKKAKEIIPPLKAAGAEIIVVVSHQRENNDIKLAENVPAGMIDIVLGGHDHHYSHQYVNGCHVIRSGSDFKQLSYIELRRKSKDGSVPGWDVDILRRDVLRELPEDPETVQLVDRLSSGLRAKLERPIGFTSVPLDARFTVVRAGESNMGNFVCDLMRYYYSGDCTIMAAGTIRGDQIYAPGVIRCLDVVSCSPFEDPVVMIKVKGHQIWDALENGVSKYPALEGRFPQVSNIKFTFDPEKEPMSRLTECSINGETLDREKYYTCVTRGYMVKGKDGFTSLMPENGAEEIVDEESGVLISMILRQYFLSLKVLGKWKHGDGVINFFGNLKRCMSQDGMLKEPQANQQQVSDEEDSDSHSDDSEYDDDVVYGEHVQQHHDEKVEQLVKSMSVKWARLAGVRKGSAEEKEYAVHWTRSVAPRLEDRITIVGKESAPGDE